MATRIRTAGLDNVTGQHKFYSGAAGDTIMGVASATPVLMDFGAVETDITVTTVLNSLVTSTSIIRPSLLLKVTVDHDEDDYIAEELKVYTQNIIPGVSFDIVLHALNNSFGQYYVNYIIN